MVDFIGVSKPFLPELISWTGLSQFLDYLQVFETLQYTWTTTDRSTLILPWVKDRIAAIHSVSELFRASAS